MLKHSVMMQQISTGQKFDATYLKKDGSFREFVGARKPMSQQERQRAEATATSEKEKKKGSQYESRIPILLQDNECPRIYTRAIVKFNGEEIIL